MGYGKAPLHRWPARWEWMEVLDGQAFFHAPSPGKLLYTRRRFMPVGGRGHVEAYAPKDMSDNEALEQLAAHYRPTVSPASRK
jgi:hypothetical protein